MVNEKREAHDAEPSPSDRSTDPPDDVRRQLALEAHKRLLRALLEEALGCFQKYVLATAPAARKLFLDAERWLMGRRHGAPITFEQVCDVLKIEPTRLQRELHRWREWVLAERSGPIQRAGSPGEPPRPPVWRRRSTAAREHGKPAAADPSRTDVRGGPARAEPRADATDDPGRRNEGGADW